MAAVSITSPIMHRLRILFLRFYPPPDSFLSILLFRLGPLGVWGGRRNIAGTATFFYVHSFPKRFQMNITQWLLAAAAVALISGTSTALAQQDPPRTAPAEKVAPNPPSGELNTPAAPDASTSGALERGTATGRSETTGQAPRNERREPNRDTEEKK